MLERLELENVGPAPKMALDLAPRLNLITPGHDPFWPCWVVWVERQAGQT